jgi:hypothetical protein
LIGLGDPIKSDERARQIDLGRFLSAKVEQLWREAPSVCQGIEKH